MRTTSERAVRWAMLLGAAASWGCIDAPTQSTLHASHASRQAEKRWDVLATTRWNARATDILQSLPPGLPTNVVAWSSRMLTYLSLAQHRAALEASAPANRPQHPSVSAAVSRASYDVLNSFFAAAPALPDTTKARIRAALDGQLADDADAPLWPGERNQDVAAGAAVGMQAATRALAEASQDGYFSAIPPTPPVGPEYWFPNAGAATVRGLWGSTPFLLAPDELLLDRAPPAYGSPEFGAAVQEVLTVVGNRTQQQLDIANKWNRGAPLAAGTSGEWNRIAVALILAHRRSEPEAASILTQANAAAFDAQIACWETKFQHWVRRPAQMSAEIQARLAFPAPNHPSYPSGHSCVSSAFAYTLAYAFPSDRDHLMSLMEEAGMSRIYAGIHYRFDIEAGQEIGRRVAARARFAPVE